MISITTAIIVISILMLLSGKEMLYVVGILMFCYCFPILPFIVVTIAVLAHHSN